MKKMMMLLLIPAVLLTFGSAAYALPVISGTIAFDGGTVNLTGGSNLNTNTGFHFTSTGSVVADTGAYGGVPVGGASPAVTFFDFTFAPLFVPAAPGWSFVSGGNTYTFDFSSGSVSFRNTHILVLEGNGVAHITGFADTPGVWNLTANEFGNTLSFSSGASVPEPGYITLLGIALAAFSLLAWRFRA